MKLTKKILAALAVIGLGASAFAVSFNPEAYVTDYNTKYSAINDGLKDFTKQLAVSVPQAAVQQNVWADAYIGKLFPSIPPHLGGGLNFGLTHMDTSGLKKACDVLAIDGMKDSYYFPVFTGDIRLGGVFLPFDADVCFVKTGSIGTEIMGADLNVELLALGFDVRYALIEGGLVLPKVSIGLGYMYNEGTFKADSKYAEAQIDYKVHTAYLSAQMSKSFLLFTPFVGVRAMVNKYDNNYKFAMKTKGYEDIINSAAYGALDSETRAGIKTSGSGSYKSDAFDFNEFQPQIYAGIGFNFFVLQTTASVTADLRNIKDKGLWSGALSVRAKL